MKRVLRFASCYLMFFLPVALLATCCVGLFVRVFSSVVGVQMTEENLRLAAELTLLNVLLLSLLCTVIDQVRQHLTVERTARQIAEATQRIASGDFSARVAPVKWLAVGEVFQDIVSSFNCMAEELASVETLRTDFIANVSHEMKTPLAALQNYGTLLRTPALAEEKRREYAGAIIDITCRMNDMMTNILRLNKLENQQFFSHTSLYDLGEQLCEVMLQYENVWEREQMEVETNLAEGVAIRADRELLALVWSNLLSNAFKFTPAGGKVEVTLSATDTWASVQVRDTGCGMTQETGAHIFEKFYQGDTSHAMRGNGLGLALVKRVVDIVHGEIHVESVVGKGSAFIVRIPRQV